MKKLIFISLLFASHYCEAQVKFQKLIGTAPGVDIGQNVRQTSDGGYIIAGRRSAVAPNYTDVLLVKTDGIGNVTWTKSFGSTYNDYGDIVKQTSDGGYIIGASLENPTHQHNFYLIKTNSTGTMTWNKIIGDNVLGEYCNDVELTSDGGYLLAGTTSAAVLVKTNSTGDTLWVRNYYNTGFFPDVYNVRQTSDGGYILGGRAYSNGLYDAWLMKTDASGIPVWSKTYGGTNDDAGYSMSLNSDGGYTLAGETSSFGSGGRDVYVIRTNSTGDTLWTRAYGGSADDYTFEYGATVQQTTDGGFIVSGNTVSFPPAGINGYLLKLNSNGSLKWSRTYGDTMYDFLNAVRQTLDGGYIATGFTYSYGANAADLYLIKTDSSGISSCHDFSAATVVTTPPTTVASQTVLYRPYGTIYTYTTNVGSGGAATTLCVLNGVDELENDEGMFSIYPNPSHNSFTVSLSKDFEIKTCELGIYDVTGRLVHREKISSQLLKVNCPLSTGIYLVKVASGDKVYTEKLVIE